MALGTQSIANISPEKGDSAPHHVEQGTFRGYMGAENGSASGMVRG